MNARFLAKPLAAAALTAGALLAAGAAHARTDVFVSIGVPGVYVQPQPAYVQTYPSYGYHDGGYRSHRRGPWGDVDRDGVPNAYDRYDNRNSNYYRSGWGDADRDGVPNRYDRRPNNPYRY